MSLNEKNKIIAVSGIFTAIIIVCLFFFILPTIGKIKSAAAEIEDLKTGLENKYRSGQSLKQAAERIKKSKPLLDQVENSFLDWNGKLEFITYLESIAQNNKVEETLEFPDRDSGAGNGLKKSDVMITASGEFGNIVSYLYELEKSNYYLNIKTLELLSADRVDQWNTAASGKAGVKKIYLKLIAETYWR